MATTREKARLTHHGRDYSGSIGRVASGRSLLVPGAIAATPYVALAWGPPHDLKAFVDASQGISTAVAAFLVVGAGLLVESIGSFAKYSIVDRWDGKREDILRAWDDYLKIAWKTEPIGARYLRRVLTTFKFELNMLVAILGTLPGIALLAYYYVLPSHAVVWTLAIAVASLLYLFKAALEDSRVLHRLRGELIVVARAQDALPPKTS